jgi:ABC-type glycerol-3-phosphate transport system substrate-binding protein
MAGRNSNRDVSLDCRQVKALQGAFLEDGLPLHQEVDVRAHLQGCGACRQAVDQEASLVSQLRLEAAGRHHMLSSQAATRIQERVQKRMRRGLTMRRTVRLAGQALAAGVVIALVAIAFAAWQYSNPQTLSLQETAAPQASALPVAVPTKGNLGDRSAPVGDVQGLVTIRFACQRHDVSEFESLAAEFHEQNPTVAVEVVAIEDIKDYLEDWQNRNLHLASAADTAYYYVDLSGALTGLLRDLAPFIEADADFAPDDFFPGMLEAFQALGGTWALPSQAQMRVLYFDKQKFDEAGIAYPTLTWTKDDFLAAARGLTRRQDGEITQYGFVDYPVGAEEALVLANLSNPLESNPPLTTPALVEAAQWYIDLARLYEVMPAPLPGEDGSWGWGRDLIDGGKAAMWSYPLNMEMVEAYRQNLQNGVGVAPFPTDGEPLVSANGYGYTMSSGTEHPQESWLWLRYLSHQRLRGSRDVLADRLPARRSVAEQSGFWDRFDSETAKVARYGAEHLVPLFAVSPKQFQAEIAITDAFGGKPVEQALAEAQATLEEQLVQAAEATSIPVVVATPRQQGPGEAVTIDFAPPPGMDAAAYRALASAFNQSQSGVQVRVVTPDQAATADCFADMRSVGDAGTRVELLDLQPLLDDDPSFSLDDFHPRFLEHFSFQGDLWGIPTQAEVRVVFYNRDLFDAAGVPYPVPGWTLDDFLTRAVALTQGDGAEKQYGFLPLNGDASDLQVFIALQGASLWDEQGRPDFDAPDAVAAVQWYTELATKYGVMPLFDDDLPEPGVAASKARNELVRTGRVAMWTDFAGIDRSSTWPTDMQVAMAPLPVGAEAVTEFLYEGLFIASDTPNASACWEWLKVVSGQTELVRGLPARRPFLESRGFADQVGREATETYRASLEYAELNRPSTPEAGAQALLVYQSLADILAGESVGAALSKAQQEAQK